jgi:hypothetical protein
MTTDGAMGARRSLAPPALLGERIFFFDVIPGKPSGPRFARAKDRLRATRDPYVPSAHPIDPPWAPAQAADAARQG